MLPTSRPANYSNSKDFRLAGGRRQILTKNIKPSLCLPSRRERPTATSRPFHYGCEDRHVLPCTPYKSESLCDKGFLVAPEYASEISTGGHVLPAGPPISLLSGDSGDTCVARCGAARPQPRMHIAHDRITRYTRGWARGNVVACGSIATRWTHAISVATGRPPRVRRPGHFAFGWRGLIARRPDFILMRPARSLARDISRVTSFRPSARSPT